MLDHLQTAIGAIGALTGLAKLALDVRHARQDSPSQTAAKTPDSESPAAPPAPRRAQQLQRANQALYADAPQCQVRAQKGQWLTVMVTARERDASGTWWYVCHLVVPDRLDTLQGPMPQRRTVKFTAPAALVRPLRGQDYSRLSGASRAEGGQRRDGGRWVTAEDHASGRRIVHRADCAQAGAEAELVGDREAVRVAADHAAGGVCSVCRPDRVLRTLY
ncbi:DUF6233 domain-containing protein [Streptomyces sp. NPDC058426]|uniref:DUF6233 domain-containing protein n=1 Tax=Streptomyces sp. NPDC058426 TaxID=3346493 RepID=UPI00366900EB